ncbi:MAG: hypothetical protein KIT11_00480 [Fimbriimonadaceae bacterium]|nr:hypothetical protein [Fimbriimonadaceae bacterium]QYK55151.1 MAG: hypothetical protein KF733_09055 [Fimbriimonadaceae bacterium]
MRPATAFLALALPSLVLPFDLEVQQVSWLRENLTVYHASSDTGQYVFRLERQDFDRMAYDPETDQYVGYLNVLASNSVFGPAQWVVKNLTVVLRDGADLVGREAWTLEAPLPCASIEFLGACWTVASFGSEPLFDAPSGSRTFSPVTQVTHLAGGGLNEQFPRPWVNTTAAHDLAVFASGRGPVPRPFPLDLHGYTLGDAGEKPGERVAIGIKETEVEKVDEAPWMCTPASSARSLKYLVKLGKITLEDDVQTITDALKTDYKTGANALNVSGTIFSDALAGAKAYSDRKRLGLDIRYEQFARNVLDDLKDGADLTMNYAIFQWKGTALNPIKVPIEGHTAFVTGITPFKDRSGAVQYYLVDTLSDINQGNRKAENVKRTYRVEENGTTLTVLNERGQPIVFGQVDDRSGFLIKKKP